MSASRDMTEKQFIAACQRHGITPNDGPFGYCTLRGGGGHVSRHNGGRTRRGQLAYLLARQAEHDQEQRAKAAIRAKVGELPGYASLRIPPGAVNRPSGDGAPYLVIEGVEEAARVAAFLRGVSQ